jgi:nucleoside-diphosphate-sugar epimerase
MKALVTGANGFTGSHLVRSLEQRGDQVIAYVRSSSNLSRLADCHPQIVYGDICDRPSFEAALQDVDLVFHTAAYVDLGVVNTAEMERVNVEGTRTLLAALQTLAYPPKLVYCSTIGIYGDSKGAIIDETFQRTQADFSSAYDRTKYLAQQLVDQAATEGLPVVSLMPAGILGSDDPHFGPVVQTFQKGVLKLWAGGDRITGIVHVDDLVQAMILAAEQETSGEHYIISAGELTTREMFTLLGQKIGIEAPKEAPEWLVRGLGTVLDSIGRLTGWNPPLSQERVHYIYDRCVRVSAAKAKRDLGWQPRPIPEVLQDLIA